MAQPEATPPSGGETGEPKSGSAALTGVAEQLTSRFINPLDLVILTRDRIQETLDDAAARGRMTRDDANELLGELLRLGRQQTEDVLSELEHLVEYGRGQIESATRLARRVEPVDRLVRTADRARQAVSPSTGFPIDGYDELTARHVVDRIGALSAAELRRVREYELRHANRKSVLSAIDKALG
jgi:polyhydroxyalkanoate synthesis regulator phasin